MPTKSRTYKIIGIVVLLAVAILIILNPFEQSVEHVNSNTYRISPLYYYSYAYEDESGKYAVLCPQTKEIDWELAINALSAYMKFEAPKEEPGAAEIQRNFDENCERNMHIYKTIGETLNERPDGKTAEILDKATN